MISSFEPPPATTEETSPRTTMAWRPSVAPHVLTRNIATAVAVIFGLVFAALLVGDQFAFIPVPPLGPWGSMAARDAAMDRNALAIFLAIVTLGPTLIAIILSVHKSVLIDDLRLTSWTLNEEKSALIIDGAYHGVYPYSDIRWVEWWRDAVCVNVSGQTLMLKRPEDPEGLADRLEQIILAYA